MMLTGNVIAILLALTSGALDTIVKERSANIVRPEMESLVFDAGPPLESLPVQNGYGGLQELHVGNGFLFVNGKYCDPASTVSWSGGLLTIDDPSTSMLAMETSSPLARSTMSDAFGGSEDFIPESVFEVSETKLSRIKNVLATGGVVNVSTDGESYCAFFSEGGIETLEVLNSPLGTERERLIDVAFDRLGAEPSVETRSWLSSYQPDSNLAERIGGVVSHVNQMEKSNIMAATAVRRFNAWSYPLTITAMMIFVIAMGSLLAARPQELVAVAHNETDVSINRFLWLIGGMSIIDLVWTLLAHQANQIAEVNPVGNVLLGDAQRTIIFKALATILAIGILYRARHSEFARKACWWICLTLALLMARWVLVSGVST